MQGRNSKEKEIEGGFMAEILPKTDMLGQGSKEKMMETLDLSFFWLN